METDLGQGQREEEPEIQQAFSTGVLSNPKMNGARRPLQYGRRSQLLRIIRRKRFAWLPLSMLFFLAA